MEINDLDLVVPRLGECRIPSPMSGVNFVADAAHVLYHGDLKVVESYQEAGKKPPCFEIAGPREKIYFDPSKLKCGIVTCGGICPGLNDVIRAIVLSLFHHYGVRTVFGFPYGFEVPFFHPLFIVVDGSELMEADWFSAQSLPALPSRISIARQLIDWFVKTRSDPQKKGTDLFFIKKGAQGLKSRKN